MRELFDDIPDSSKRAAEFWVQCVFQQQNPMIAMKSLEEYRKNCFNDREREFIDFCFDLELEKLRNDKSNFNIG